MRPGAKPLTLGDFADFHFATTLAAEGGSLARKRLIALAWPAKGSLVIYRVESCDTMVFESPSLPMAIERYNEL